MGNDAPLEARIYGLQVGDYQLVNDWWMARHDRPFLETLIPPLGVFAERDGEPQAVAWAYESAGVGVAFLEHVITRPGLSFKDADAAFGCCLRGIEFLLRGRGYSVLRCIADERVARAAIAHGFQGVQGFSNLVKTF